MTDNQLGFVTRFPDYSFNEYNNKQLINLRCIIHQEALCANSVALNTILKDVNRIVLFISANTLHHRQFLENLPLRESFSEDIIYYSTSCCLSHGETS